MSNLPMIMEDVSADSQTISLATLLEETERERILREAYEYGTHGAYSQNQYRYCVILLKSLPLDLEKVDLLVTALYSLWLIEDKRKIQVCSQVVQRYRNSTFEFVQESLLFLFDKNHGVSELLSLLHYAKVSHIFIGSGKFSMAVDTLQLALKYCYPSRFIINTIIWSVYSIAMEDERAARPYLDALREQFKTAVHGQRAHQIAAATGCLFVGTSFNMGFLLVHLALALQRQSNLLDAFGEFGSSAGSQTAGSASINDSDSVIINGDATTPVPTFEQLYDEIDAGCVPHDGSNNMSSEKRDSWDRPTSPPQADADPVVSKKIDTKERRRLPYKTRAIRPSGEVRTVFEFVPDNTPDLEVWELVVSAAYSLIVPVPVPIAAPPLTQDAAPTPVTATVDSIQEPSVEVDDSQSCQQQETEIRTLDADVAVDENENEDEIPRPVKLKQKLQWFEDSELWLAVGLALEETPLVLLTERSFLEAFMRRPTWSAEVIRHTIESMERRKADLSQTYRVLSDALRVSPWNIYCREKIVEVEASPSWMNIRTYTYRFEYEIKKLIRLQRRIKNFVFSFHWEEEKERIYRTQTAILESFQRSCELARQLEYKVQLNFTNENFIAWRAEASRTRKEKMYAAMRVQTVFRRYKGTKDYTVRKLRMRIANRKFLTAFEMDFNFNRMFHFRAWRALYLLRTRTRAMEIVENFLMVSRYINQYKARKAQLVKFAAQRRAHLKVQYMRKWRLRLQRYYRVMARFIIRNAVRDHLLRKSGMTEEELRAMKAKYKTMKFIHPDVSGDREDDSAYIRHELQIIRIRKRWVWIKWWKAIQVNNRARAREKVALLLPKLIRRAWNRQFLRLRRARIELQRQAGTLIARSKKRKLFRLWRRAFRIQRFQKIATKVIEKMNAKRQKKLSDVRGSLQHKYERRYKKYTLEQWKKLHQRARVAAMRMTHFFQFIAARKLLRRKRIVTAFAFRLGFIVKRNLFQRFDNHCYVSAIDRSLTGVFGVLHRLACLTAFRRWKSRSRQQVAVRRFAWRRPFGGSEEERNRRKYVVDALRGHRALLDGNEALLLKSMRLWECLSKSLMLQRRQICGLAVSSLIETGFAKALRRHESALAIQCMARCHAARARVTRQRKFLQLKHQRDRKVYREIFDCYRLAFAARKHAVSKLQMFAKLQLARMMAKRIYKKKLIERDRLEKVSEVCHQVICRRLLERVMRNFQFIYSLRQLQEKRPDLQLPHIGRSNLEEAFLMSHMSSDPQMREYCFVPLLPNTIPSSPSPFSRALSPLESSPSKTFELVAEGLGSPLYPLSEYGSNIFDPFTHESGMLSPASNQANAPMGKSLLSPIYQSKKSKGYPIIPRESPLNQSFWDAMQAEGTGSHNLSIAIPDLGLKVSASAAATASFLNATSKRRLAAMKAELRDASPQKSPMARQSSRGSLRKSSRMSARSDSLFSLSAQSVDSLGTLSTKATESTHVKSVAPVIAPPPRIKKEKKKTSAVRGANNSASTVTVISPYMSSADVRRIKREAALAARELDQQKRSQTAQGARPDSSLTTTMPRLPSQNRSRDLQTPIENEGRQFEAYLVDDRQARAQTAGTIPAHSLSNAMDISDISVRWNLPRLIESAPVPAPIPFAVSTRTRKDFESSEYHSYLFQLKKSGVFTMNVAAMTLSRPEVERCLKDASAVICQSVTSRAALDIAWHFAGTKLILLGGKMTERDVSYLSDALLARPRGKPSPAFTLQLDKVRFTSHAAQVSLVCCLLTVDHHADKEQTHSPAKRALLASLSKPPEQSSWSDRRTGMLAINQHNFVNVKMISVDFSGLGCLAFATLLSGLRYNSSVEVLVLTFDTSWVPSVIADCLLFMRPNNTLKELVLRGQPLREAILRALHFSLLSTDASTFTAGPGPDSPGPGNVGLAALERLEYRIDPSDGASQKASDRILQYSNFRNKTTVTKLIVEVVVPQDT